MSSIILALLPEGEAGSCLGFLGGRVPWFPPSRAPLTPTKLLYLNALYPGGMWAILPSSLLQPPAGLQVQGALRTAGVIRAGFLKEVAVLIAGQALDVRREESVLSACGWERHGRPRAKVEEVPHPRLFLMEGTWAELADQLTDPVPSYCHLLFFQAQVPYIVLRKHQVTLTLAFIHTILPHLSLREACGLWQLLPPISHVTLDKPLHLFEPASSLILRGIVQFHCRESIWNGLQRVSRSSVGKDRWGDNDSR